MQYPIWFGMTIRDKMEARKGKTSPNAMLPTYKILIFACIIEILPNFLHDIFLMHFFKLGLKGGRGGWNETGEQKQKRKNYQKQIAEKIF